MNLPDWIYRRMPKKKPTERELMVQLADLKTRLDASVAAITAALPKVTALTTATGELTAALPAG